MREKIAKWLATDEVSNILEHLDFEEVLAAQLLTLVSEEIEKVRKNNPYPEPSLASAEYYEANGYDRACRKILSLLK